MLNKGALAASVAAAAKLYVEDVFSTWLYTGNGSTQTITNGIDLSGKGGLVWTKARSAAEVHEAVDTVRGLNTLYPNLPNAQAGGAEIAGFNSNGYSLTYATGNGNTNGVTYASWTFRKAAKFFDIVTYTGNGANRTIAHNLGSVPGTIIVKRTDTTGDWQVYHRSLANTEYMVLNSTAAKATGATRWNSTTPTSTVFSLGTDATVNASGGTYVAYLFAHDAGGFGDSENDNVVSCGSYVGNGAAGPGPTINLGWEPQWLLVKRSTGTAGNASDNWTIVDTMRGFSASIEDSAQLYPNTQGVENFASFGLVAHITATGFRVGQQRNVNGETYIYIAIRRGPMKTPTDATKVFGLSARTGTGADATVTGGQVDDAVLIKNRGSAVGDLFAARLTGTGYLETSSTAAEVAAGTTILQANPWDVMDGVKVGTTSTITNASANTFINYLFRRAPGFFDVVAWTASASTSITHGLGVTPELIIAKSRSVAGESWTVYTQAGGRGNVLFLNAINGNVGIADYWGTSGPTSTAFGVAASGSSNNAGNMIAYLFASCPGVSKVFNFTGTGTTKQIDCGFTNGARFVMIKRTDSNGDWYVWDSARGIISGNDPYLLLSSTAAEVTNTDYIDPYSAGFEISSTAPAAINANGGSYIGLAIA